MTKISNLHRDLTEEVLSKVPLTSLRTVRSICKKWNTLSKDLSFAKKHLAGQAKVAETQREFMVVMRMDYMVYLMSVNLDTVVESCLKPQGKLFSLDGEVDNVNQVFHCDGLLLCITNNNTRLIVCNPYWGQIRRIEPRTFNYSLRYSYSYALGFDKKSKSYKILRFANYYVDGSNSPYTFFTVDIYNFSSDSWRFLDKETPRDWKISYNEAHGVTLKGNTYWFAIETYSETNEGEDRFLVCFDFTSETFGPRLSLPVPFEVYENIYTLSLYVVREEQLAVLSFSDNTSTLEIWVTTKIEPNAVSWNNKVFLTANIQQLIRPELRFTSASFFIDEERKVAVVFSKDKDIKCYTPNNKAYIFGVDGSLKEVDLGGECAPGPRVCSYAPSLVQLN